MTKVSTTGPLLPARRARVLRRFLDNRVACTAVACVVVLVGVALLAPWLAPADPNAQTLGDRLLPPGAEGYLLGTDEFGRDQLSRLIFGSRLSLAAALYAIVVALVGGVPLGVLAGFSSRWLDSLLSRVFDALMSVPFLIFALSIIAILGPGLTNAMVAVGVAFTPSFFRLARAATQEVRHELFIEASIAIGCTLRRTVMRHVLPNVVSPLAVQTSVTLGLAVSAEAGLSFLGLGVSPPTASWGGMLRTALQNIHTAPFLVFAPGAMIAATVLSFTLIGDGLRQALGTRQIGTVRET